MGEFGKSLSGAITSQRSYGSTNTHTFSLAVIDSKVITHRLQPSDTLQSLAIKYGVSVEKLKRLNKLWSNESIHTKDTLLIPCPNLNTTDGGDNSKNVFKEYEAIEEISVRKGVRKKTENLTSSQDELHSSLKENEGDGSNTSCKKNENSLQSLDKMFSKVDRQINTQKKLEADDLGSDSYKCFTEMLSKIDSQIKMHKHKVQSADSSSVPVVGYDSYQHIENGSHVSPTRQHPFLEQGI